MSNQRVTTNLQGYKNQLFSENTEMLNIVYSDYIFSNRAIANIGSRINGYLFDDEPVTSDGYKWFVGVYFKSKKGKIAVLFPYMRDSEKKDSTTLDRSISFYTDGKVEESQVNHLSSEFYDRIMNSF